MPAKMLCMSMAVFMRPTYMSIYRQAAETKRSICETCKMLHHTLLIFFCAIFLDVLCVCPAWLTGHKWKSRVKIIASNVTCNENKWPNAAQSSASHRRWLIRCLHFFSHTIAPTARIRQLTFMAMIYVSLSSGMVFDFDSTVRIRLCLLQMKPNPRARITF